VEREGSEGGGESKEAKRGFHGSVLGAGEQKFILGKHDACLDGGEWGIRDGKSDVARGGKVERVGGEYSDGAKT
jgi:hypothetical protein